MGHPLDSMSEHKKNTTRIATSIGKRIRLLRQRRRLTQEEFSQKCFGANAQGRVSHYENSRREPSIDDIRVMARVLGVSEQELISGQGRRVSLEQIKEIPLLTIQFFKKRQGKTRMATRVRERIPVPAGLAVSDKAFAVRLDAAIGVLPDEFSDGDVIICDPLVRAKATHYVWVTLPDDELPIVCRYDSIAAKDRAQSTLHGVIVAKMKTFI